MTAIQMPVRAGMLLLAVLLFAAAPQACAEPVEPAATANDVARFLAGLEPSPGSPLALLTRDRGWQRHARALDADWSKLEKQRLTKIRAWSATHLSRAKPTVLYMFSGPDFLYVDAFFPDRSVYVLSGLEPVGEIPAVTSPMRRSLGSTLAALRASIGSALSYSFFITERMKVSLRAGRLDGVLPVLYLFLVRSGKTIHEVTLLGIDKTGAVVPEGTRDAVEGVKIVFSGPSGRMQTLYYFRTDLSNHGVQRSGFLEFCRKLGPADAFIKSASYLLHSGNFTRLRAFLLEHAAVVVQDDSGIPVHHFSAVEWHLQPFGRYLGPISVFPGRYQNRLEAIYRRSRPPRLDFGVGYRWRPNESNLLLASRGSQKEVAQDAAGAK